MIVMVSASACDKDIYVEPTALPKAASAFISEHFPDSRILSVKKEHDFMITEYDVYLSDGTEITFDKKGIWKDVDCERRALPQSVIPEVIKNYIDTNFPEMTVEDISKEHYGYEISFVGELELHFDKNGKFLGADH